MGIVTSLKVVLADLVGRKKALQLWDFYFIKLLSCHKTAASQRVGDGDEDVPKDRGSSVRQREVCGCIRGCAQNGQAQIR